MKNLEPKILWNYFYEITQIPRPSKKEDKVRTFLKKFASDKSLEIKEDKAGNILILVPATEGYENNPTIILQAHMDMVCEKNNDVKHDFDNDPIDAYVDGDWVTARGTTLGADNGIGMAMMLAVIDSKDVKHPPLECLFTTDEETGLTGAFALDKNLLTGTTLINLDSEDDGQIFVGCAGGTNTEIEYKYKTKETPEGYFAFSTQISGLKGGHSGGDIHKHRGNALKMLDRILWNIWRKMDLLLVEFEGGNLHNAIPREAKALCCVPFKYKEDVRIIFNHIVNDLEEEYAAYEPDMKIELHSENIPEETMNENDSFEFLNAIYACPNGVQEMSLDIPGLVETSTNLASVKMEKKNRMKIVTSQRSSVESSRKDIATQVASVFNLIGADVKHSDGYPGWKPNLNSAILKITTDSYKKLFAKEPEVLAIHAGLECGLFLEKYPNLDMVSIGPEMLGVHSPDEKLNIASTQKTWKWLVEILSAL